MLLDKETERRKPLTVDGFFKNIKQCFSGLNDERWKWINRKSSQLYMKHHERQLPKRKPWFITALSVV